MAQTAAIKRSFNDTIAYTPTSNKQAGDVFEFAPRLLGIALADIPANTSGPLEVDGVFDLPKSSDAFDVGTPVFWDRDGTPVTGTAASGAATNAVGVYAGICIRDANAAASYVRTRMGAWAAVGATEVLVASSTAPSHVKAAANYVCDGVDDHVEIQAALDSFGPLGGRVVLSDGYFELGKSDESTELSGTGTLTSQRLDVGAAYGQIQVGDMISIRDGDYSGSTLQARNADGIYAVEYVTGFGGSATQVKFRSVFSQTFTNVNWVRPAYSLRMPPAVTLQGQGLGRTALRLQVGENCSIIWMSTNGQRTVGTQRLENLSILGRNANQTADWWKCNGVMTGIAYDVHVHDCEVRYCKGVGIAIGEGWGFVMRGGWVEDCQICVHETTGYSKIMQCKIQQAGVTTTNGAPIQYTKGGNALLVGCEVRAGTNAPRAILLRGSYGHTINGCLLEASSNAYGCIECVDCDGSTNRSLCAEGNHYECMATSYVLNLVSWLMGGTVSGLVNGDPTNAINGYASSATGLQINLAGTYLTQYPAYTMRSIGVLNNTGGSLADGYSYVWDNTAAEGAVRLPAAAGDVGLFAGVNNTYPTANAARGYLTVQGLVQISVNAATAIAINDLLALDTGGSDWGRMKKAASTEIAFARALAAKASGTGVIAAELIPPRAIP